MPCDVGWRGVILHCWVVVEFCIGVYQGEQRERGWMHANRIAYVNAGARCHVWGGAGKYDVR